MQLLNLVIKHERRIRLIFDKPVNFTAFNVNLYKLTNIDGAGSTPDISKAYIVANSPYTVELALSLDLSRGSSYTIDVFGIQALDNSITPDPSQLKFTFAASTAATIKNTKTGINSLYTKLYGLDILFEMQSGDFVERQDGDLLTVSGPTTVKEALWKRVLSNGLPWNNNYGLKPREFVDAASTSLDEMVTSAKGQLLLDDRVESAEVSLSTDTKAAQGYLNMKVKLIGDQLIDLSISPLTKQG